jgi:ribosomal protein S18 acetylase RimI-like enzyme
LVRNYIDIITEAQALLVKHLQLKDGTEAKVWVRKSLDDSIEVELKVKTATGWKNIGWGSFGENDWNGDPGEWSAMNMHVDAEWKRRGVATAMYDAVEKVVGKVVPEPRFHKRSEEANAFWRARNPSEYGNY